MLSTEHIPHSAGRLRTAAERRAPITPLRLGPRVAAHPGEPFEVQPSSVGSVRAAFAMEPSTA